MSKKIALCRVSDTEPLLSLVRMLEYAGYECVLPGIALNNYLRGIGCKNVDEWEDMRDRWGAEMPPEWLDELYNVVSLHNVDLYVDVNAFHNGPLLWKEWPSLMKKTLCYFINGGPPRNTADKGDGITPACPVMTTNQWYKSDYNLWKTANDKPLPLGALAANATLEMYQKELRDIKEVAPWADKSYVFYPSFERWDRVVPRTPDFGGSPVCFCHNVMGWGYGEYVEAARNLGVKFYGGGSSPNGLVRHEDVFSKLAEAPCVVYLKGGGAVDYAVLEAMAMGVPVLTPMKYAADTLTRPLLGDALMLDDRDLIGEITSAVNVLRDPVRNFGLGNWGRERVKELCWQSKRDGPGFKTWLERMFP